MVQSRTFLWWSLSPNTKKSQDNRSSPGEVWPCQASYFPPIVTLRAQSETRKVRKEWETAKNERELYLKHESAHFRGRWDNSWKTGGAAWTKVSGVEWHDGPGRQMTKVRRKSFHHLPTTTTSTTTTASTTSAHPGPPPAAHVVEQEPELQQAPKTFEAALDRPLFQCLQVLCQITQLFMNRCPSPRGRCPSWGLYGQRRAYGQTENISLFRKNGRT